jgi:RNA polymerase sigma-70 factor (ECF subfamily)
LEQRIQSLLARRDFRAAATQAVEGYGPEVFGFLVAFVRDPRDASEIFSQTCEDLWVGLPRFERKCSMRTWMYTLARHAAARFRRSAHRRPGRHVALSAVSEMAVRVRTETLRFLRSEAKDLFAPIRDALEEDDRMLLVLRVDRGMGWKEIARVLAGDDDGDEALDRAAARLRKRFQLVKDDIRARAEEAGLLGKASSRKRARRTQRAVSARSPSSSQS